MYQLPQNTQYVLSPVTPQIIPQTTLTQSYIPQVTPTYNSIPYQNFIPPTPQVNTQTYTPQIIIPQTQVTTIPQVQSVVPLVQNVPIQSFVQTPMAQAPVITPFVLPRGSRFPMAQNHQGTLNSSLNFNNIGGSPYGRVSMIK